MSDDLKVLFPGQPVSLAGETYTIKPFTFGALPKVLGVLRAMASELKADEIDVLKLIESHLGDMTALMALATGKPAEWIGGLQMDEAIALATAIVEENKEVFNRAVMPKLSALLAGLGVVPSTGETSSAPSSQPATDTTTSGATA